MKQQLQSLVQKFKRVFKVHQAFVVILGVLIVLLVVVVRLNELNNMQPDPVTIDDQITKVKVVRFDHEALEAIQSLRESNVTVPGTELPVDRQNPFNE